MSAQAGNIIYLGPPGWTREQAIVESQRLGFGEPLWLGRRGYGIGWVAQNRSTNTAKVDARALWQSGNGVFLPGLVASDLAAQQVHITAAQGLMERILEGEGGADLLDEEPYATRLAPQFELLASTCDAGDDQEIETLEFDVLENGNIVAENLWVKLSWLSYDEDDASLRFRFSFGMVGYEDVSADYQRQQYAAQLTEAVFPESCIISANPEVERILCSTLAIKAPAYVERIVYFNAPNGGAQFHQDVERGHLGVIFAQVYGRTSWLAVPKPSLIEEIQRYLARPDAHAALIEAGVKPRGLKTLLAKAANSDSLSAYLDDHQNDPLDILINRAPAFAQQLIEAGYAYMLEPGDVILLPQQGVDHCCWHSVFCMDDYSGEALSFAVRERL
ncbi:MAG: hypothetical protein M3A44_08995 [Gammaproteobacteria bacterium]